MSNEQQIYCPQCGTIINVNEMIYHKIEKEFKQESLKKEEEIKQKEALLQKKEEEVKKQKANFVQEVKNTAEARIKEEIPKIEQALKTKVSKEYLSSIEMLKQELEDKKTQVAELNQAKLEIEKLKNENTALADKIKTEVEIEFYKKLSEERMKIMSEADKKNEFKLKEQEKQLDDLKKQLQEAQRKAELTSQQLQGEVQELAIEDYLKNKYPFDTIEEVKKGVRGGDCIQIVNTREMFNCGKIYYESKRAKEFQSGWIEKFKTDMRNAEIEVGVIVTETLPKELERFGLLDGVWVCTYEEFKGLSAVLRESIININLVKKTEENKNDKISLLYEYLTSPKFKMQIEAIVEGFSTMQEDLNKEKRAMQKIWKQREVQIDKVITSTINMYGSLRGIAGNSIGEIEALELKPNDVEEPSLLENYSY